MEPFPWVHLAQNAMFHRCSVFGLSSFSHDVFVHGKLGAMGELILPTLIKPIKGRGICKLFAYLSMILQYRYAPCSTWWLAFHSWLFTIQCQVIFSRVRTSIAECSTVLARYGQGASPVAWKCMLVDRCPKKILPTADRAFVSFFICDWWFM